MLVAFWLARFDCIATISTCGDCCLYRLLLTIRTWPASQARLVALHSDWKPGSIVAGRARLSGRIGNAMDVTVRQTNAAVADGEVVWSWRPDAGAKLAGMMIARATGARKPGPWGEREGHR